MSASSVWGRERASSTTAPMDLNFRACATSSGKPPVTSCASKTSTAVRAPPRACAVSAGLKGSTTRLPSSRPNSGRSCANSRSIIASSEPIRRTRTGRLTNVRSHSDWRSPSRPGFVSFAQGNSSITRIAGSSSSTNCIRESRSYQFPDGRAMPASTAGSGRVEERSVSAARRICTSTGVPFMPATTPYATPLRSAKCSTSLDLPT